MSAESSFTSRNSSDESTAATPSREALRRIRELEAINAQITRHRDHLAEALEEIAAAPEWWQGKVAREALDG